MSRLIKAFNDDDSGATAIEYGFICCMIFLTIVTTLYTFQSRLNTVWQTIGNAMASTGN